MHLPFETAYQHVLGAIWAIRPSRLYTSFGFPPLDTTRRDRSSTSSTRNGIPARAGRHLDHLTIPELIGVFGYSPLDTTRRDCASTPSVRNIIPACAGRHSNHLTIPELIGVFGYSPLDTARRDRASTRTVRNGLTACAGCHLGHLTIWAYVVFELHISIRIAVTAR